MFLFKRGKRIPPTPVLDSESGFRAEEHHADQDRAAGRGADGMWSCSGTEKNKAWSLMDVGKTGRTSLDPSLFISAVSCSPGLASFQLLLTPTVPKKSCLRCSSQPSSDRLAAAGPHLDTLDPEAKGGSRADSLPPLHVAGLSDSSLGMLLRGGGSGVHSHHLLIHVPPGPGSFPRLHQFLLQVGPGTQMMV